MAIGIVAQITFCLVGMLVRVWNFPLDISLASENLPHFSYENVIKQVHVLFIKLYI